MQKEIHIEFCWGWKDWICSKKRYGIRIQSFWIGISAKIPQRDFDERQNAMHDWLETMRDA
jgi:hypothetical protein